MQEKPESLRERKSCNKSPPQSYYISAATKKMAEREEREREKTHMGGSIKNNKKEHNTSNLATTMEIRKTETESCLYNKRERTDRLRWRR